MKVPVKCNLKEQDASAEGLGILYGLEMVVTHKIDFPVDEIKIVPSRGIKLDMWEVATYQAALKLWEKKQVETGRDFEHFEGRVHILARYIRDAMNFAMSELSNDGKHVFTALIDRPKWAKNNTPTPVKETVDPMADLIAQEMQSEIDLDNVSEEIEEEVVVKKPKKKAKKKTPVAGKKPPVEEKVGIIDVVEMTPFKDPNKKMTSHLYKPTGKVKTKHMAVPKQPGRDYNIKGATRRGPGMKSKNRFGKNPFNKSPF